MIQYTIMVVIRYDTIVGVMHYTFTSITFFLVFLYHSVVQSESDEYRHVKNAFFYLSVISLCFFGILIMQNIEIESNTHEKTNSSTFFLACVFEIIGILSAACLDLIDICEYGEEVTVQ